MSDNAATPADPTTATATAPTSPGAAAPEETTPPTSGRAPAKDPLRGSRTSGAWAAVVGLGILLLLLIVFIAQNTQTVNIAFFGWDGKAPLAVAVLIAAAAGLLLATAAGSLRILQLRRRVRKGKRS
ncbi:MAG: hypothetical protein JWN22_2475 [Nocardioides sp.]|jgi:uncharacterized integral membrane protein|nr:hypothetical protein [Nocardioides sp.]